MLANIKNFFNQYIKDHVGDSRDDGNHRLKIATAALLIEMMRADYEASDSELDAVTLALRDTFSLSGEETAKLIDLAEQQARQATCYYEFTRLINQEYSADQKVKLIELLWQVAYADRNLQKYEEALVRKVAELIYVPHAEFIAAKHRVLERLQQ